MDAEGMRVSHDMSRVSDLYNRGTGEQHNVIIKRIPEDADVGEMGSPAPTPETVIVNGYPCSIRPLRGDQRTHPQGDTVIQEWLMVGPAMYDANGIVLFKLNDLVYDGSAVYTIQHVPNPGTNLFEIPLRLGEVGDVQSY